MLLFVHSLILIIINGPRSNSGDGGWYGFEQSIADKLANLGIPIIGLDSKKYFWKRRIPEGTASDTIKVLNFYSTEWGKQRFLLIGYSLGAEIVPFITSRLPGEMRTKVTTKIPILAEKGFWSMAHEARTDFAMTSCLFISYFFAVTDGQQI